MLPFCPFQMPLLDDPELAAVAAQLDDPWQQSDSSDSGISDSEWPSWVSLMQLLSRSHPLVLICSQDRTCLTCFLVVWGLLWFKLTGRACSRFSPQPWSLTMTHYLLSANWTLLSPRPLPMAHCHPPLIPLRVWSRILHCFLKFHQCRLSRSKQNSLTPLLGRRP